MQNPKKVTFEQAVRHFYKTGMGRTAAVKQAVQVFPDLHAEYLKRANSGKPHNLAAAFIDKGGEPA